MRVINACGEVHLQFKKDQLSNGLFLTRVDKSHLILIRFHGCQFRNWKQQEPFCDKKSSKIFSKIHELPLKSCSDLNNMLLLPWRGFNVWFTVILTSYLYSLIYYNSERLTIQHFKYQHFAVSQHSTFHFIHETFLGYNFPTVSFGGKSWLEFRLKYFVISPENLV